MAARVENESEILLGNKQLLAVFTVVAVLLAIAFTCGYMLGKSAGEKKPAESAAAGPAPGEASGGPITQKITPDDPAKIEAAPEEQPKAEPTAKTYSGTDRSASIAQVAEPVLGQRHTDNGGVPKAGQTYVQVAALAHTQAEATAEVLRKQKFHALIAPKPGNNAIYRVLVGPTKDAADFTSTRDALRKIGFREVIAQKY
jgi:cell division septation protein DedD